MSEFTIRLADPDGKDDGAIGELLVRTFVSRYALKMPEVVVSDERKADLRNVAEKRSLGAVLVAEQEGRILGAVTLFPPGCPRSEAWTEKSADLRFLGIDPAQKVSGVASALLSETERLARQWGCEAICLHVRRGALGVARLYVGRGYVREPAGDLDFPEIYLEAYRFTLHPQLSS